MVEVKVSCCAKNAELAAVVQGVLAKIVDLTKEQSAAFEKRDHGRMMRLDNQLENAIGEKERAIGAWNEHRKEHGC
ncbi:MAG: hypothetical protein ACRD5F_15475 [Candidatus Acidiferrales bacterium]